MLYRYIPLIKGEAPSECPVAMGVSGAATRIIQIFKKDYELRFYKHYEAENMVDCALCKLDSPDLVNPSILDLGEVTGVAEARPGMRVQKSGRTSGLTEGAVKSIGTTLEVEMEKNEKLWFSDQVVTDMPSQPGDSGSLILTKDRKAVGLLFAGSDKLTVFNRIGNVMERLNIEF
ncbi:MAG: S1 family peptidase [Firmicutes bacterium]|nr:S1 family peptidase [Bacillota bacterium]